MAHDKRFKRFQEFVESILDEFGYRACTKCNGSGKLKGQFCPVCHGSGQESTLDEEGEGGSAVPANNAGSGNIAGLGVPAGSKFGEPGGPNPLGGYTSGKKRKHYKEWDQTPNPIEGGERLTELTDAEVEAAAKKVHDTWVANQKKDGKSEHKSPDGKEDYMVPYEKLKEKSKDMDRDAVKATVDALGLDEERETFAGSPVFEVDTDKWMKSRFGKNRYHRYSRYVGEDDAGEAIRQHGRTKRKDDIILKDQTTGAMTYFLRRKKAGQ